MDYDNTISITGPSEDIAKITEVLAADGCSGTIIASSRRVRFTTCTENCIKVDLAIQLSKAYPRVTVAFDCWAEYGQSHGFAIFVCGLEEYSEFGHGVPGAHEDPDEGDAAAALIRERYRRMIEGFLGK